jgi:hypothetical protein
MALNDYSNPRVISNVTGIAGGTPDTGEMRRKYNFSDKFTELSIDQTPFFRIVSQIGKKPTDDPQFKYTEKRQSWMKRYSYVVGHSTSSATASQVDADLDADTIYLFMATDYLSQGNVQNVIGQTGKVLGAVGTRPEYFLPNQIVKVNVNTADDGGGFGKGMSDYALYQILDGATAGDDIDAGCVCLAADAGASAGDFKTTTEYAALSSPDASKWAECQRLKVKQIKAPPATAYLCSYLGDVPVTDVAPNSNQTNSVSGTLEAARSYVTGTAYKEGSTLMEVNWSDQPYSTGFGYTQIFRTEFGMTNTARATALKYEPNEWARLWKDKLIEHKWEIEQTALFGSQGTATPNSDTVYYTQGAVDYVLNNGNLFDMSLTTKTQDSFLEDLSMLVDPRYNNSKGMMFFCDTATYNWLHKMGGYFQNNLEISPNYNADFAVTGKRKSFGIDFTTISTVYGDINVARNIHLDGSGVKILGINMQYAKWRPLMGNGVNRDTSIYVGVQTLENTGTDKRVDMILTEGGFEFSMPECHALWK